MSLEKSKFWGNPRTPVDGSTIRGTGKGKKPNKNPDRQLYGTGKESQDKKIKKIEDYNRRKKAEREMDGY